MIKNASQDTENSVAYRKMKSEFISEEELHNER